MKKGTTASPGPVLFSALLAAAVIVCAAAVWMFSFSALWNVSQRLEENARIEAEAKRNFSYIMNAFRWDGRELVIDGYFRNTNTEHHLLNVDIMFISVTDALGQEIGAHIMNDDYAKGFRIPAGSTVPYSFRVHPLPGRKIDSYDIQEKGPQLHFFTYLTVGKCIGSDCLWCYPDGAVLTHILH